MMIMLCCICKLGLINHKSLRTYSQIATAVRCHSSSYGFVHNVRFVHTVYVYVSNTYTQCQKFAGTHQKQIFKLDRNNSFAWSMSDVCICMENSCLLRDEKMSIKFAICISMANFCTKNMLFNVYVVSRGTFYRETKSFQDRSIYQINKKGIEFTGAKLKSHGLCLHFTIFLHLFFSLTGCQPICHFVSTTKIIHVRNL